MNRHTIAKHNNNVIAKQKRSALRTEPLQRVHNKHQRFSATTRVEPILACRNLQKVHLRRVEQTREAVLHHLVDDFAPPGLLPLQRLHANLPHQHTRLRALLHLVQVAALSHPDHLLAHSLIHQLQMDRHSKIAHCLLSHHA